MNVLVLTQDWNDVPQGTKFFFQDGLWFYKTITEEERWLTGDEVNAMGGLLRHATALEFFYYCYQKN